MYISDNCEPSPCVDGSCVDLGSTYRCDCDAGYGGTNCETNIGEYTSLYYTQVDFVAKTLPARYVLHFKVSWLGCNVLVLYIYIYIRISNGVASLYLGNANGAEKKKRLIRESTRYRQNVSSINRNIHIYILFLFLKCQLAACVTKTSAIPLCFTKKECTKPNVANGLCMQQVLIQCHTCRRQRQQF